MIVFGLVGFWLISTFNRIRSVEYRQHAINPPTYETLVGEGFSGSGFHFKVDDEVFICTTLHQFDGRVPSVMGSLDFDEPIKVMGVKHTQEDVQVLEFGSGELDKIEPLSYVREAVIDQGTPVYVYCDEGAIKGHVRFVYKSDGTIKIRMEKAFAAGGQSGSPIISAETGNVIAVLIAADSTSAATRVEAEQLVFPTE